MDSMIPVVNHRPGKFWKFLQFPLTRFVLAVGVIALCVAIPQVGAKLLGLHPHTPAWAVVGFVIAAAVLLGYSAYVRVIEKRAVVELHRASALTRFGLGAL